MGTVKTPYSRIIGRSFKCSNYSLEVSRESLDTAIANDVSKIHPAEAVLLCEWCADATHQ